MKRKFTLIFLLIIAAVSLTFGLTACSQSFKDSYDYLVTFNYNTESLDLEGDFENQYLGVNAGSRIMQPRKPGTSQYSESDFKEKQINRYAIQGWYVPKYDEEGNVLKDEQGMAVEDRMWNFTTDVVNGNLTLYAKLVLKPSIRLMVDGKIDTEKNFVVGREVSETAFKANEPSKEDCTFCGYYYDTEFKNKFTFPYRMGEEDITIYAKFIEGTNWDVVTTAKEFYDAYTASAKIYVEADIDFTGAEWKKTGLEFSGEINGNGHTLKNITFALSNTYGGGAQINFGLFGVLNASAYVHDVTFENVNATVSTISRTAIQAALFAWSIRDGAKLENVTVSGTIKIGTVYEGSDITLSAVCCQGSVDGENIKNCDFSAITVINDKEGENS